MACLPVGFGRREGGGRGLYSRRPFPILTLLAIAALLCAANASVDEAAEAATAERRAALKKARANPGAFVYLSNGNVVFYTVQKRAGTELLHVTAIESKINGDCVRQFTSNGDYQGGVNVAGVLVDYTTVPPTRRDGTFAMEDLLCKPLAERPSPPEFPRDAHFSIFSRANDSRAVVDLLCCFASARNPLLSRRPFIPERHISARSSCFFSRGNPFPFTD